jgi:CBS domain-containing protein
MRSAKGDPTISLEQNLRTERIRHLRLAEPTCLPPTAPLSRAIEKMRQDRSACTLVCDGDRLVGIFTERDVLRKVIGETVDLSAPLQTLMTPLPRSLAPDDTLLDAIDLMTEGGYRHVPLTDSSGRLVGLVSAHDIVDHITEHFPTEVHNLPPRLHQKPRRPEGA